MLTEEEKALLYSGLMAAAYLSRREGNSEQADAYHVIYNKLQKILQEQKHDVYKLLVKVEGVWIRLSRDRYNGYAEEAGVSTISIEEARLLMKLLPPAIEECIQAQEEYIKDTIANYQKQLTELRKQT